MVVFVTALSTLFLAACNEKQPTPKPTNTPEMIDLENLVPAAEQLCTSASGEPVSGATPQPPVVVVKNTEYKDGEWKYYGIGKAGVDAALSTSDAKTAVCINERRIKVGQYTNGAIAYQVKWEVSVVDWSTGSLLMPVQSFLGKKPPEWKTGENDYTAEAPWVDFQNWLMRTFRDKNRPAPIEGTPGSSGG